VGKPEPQQIEPDALGGFKRAEHSDLPDAYLTSYGTGRVISFHRSEWLLSVGSVVRWYAIFHRGIGVECARRARRSPGREGRWAPSISRTGGFVVQTALSYAGSCEKTVKVVADSIGLDFLNSIAVLMDFKFERVTFGQDLLAWLQRVRFARDGVLDCFRRSSFCGRRGYCGRPGSRPGSLRDWFKPFVSEHMDASFESRAPEPLNQVLARGGELDQNVARDWFRTSERRHT
jgi:hypothetical protein